MTEHEVTEQLIAFLRGRSEHGQRKYGVALKPFDGRNTLMDALEEVTDLSQYIMKRVMENEEIAELLDEASVTIENFADGENEIIERLRETAAKLRADCERSVPVDHIPDATKKVGPVFTQTWTPAYNGPAERLAQMEGEA